MPINGTVNHFEMNVSNLDKTIAFWEPLLLKLNYELFQSWPQGRSYLLGDTYLVFVQTETPFLDALFHRKHTGLNHIAFHVDSLTTLAEFKTWLTTRDATFLYPERYPHAGGDDVYTLFFEDPDRIKVELVAPLE